MSISSNIPGKYFRAGIAIATELREPFEERLAKLGLKSMGELATMFTTADESIVQALVPYAQEYLDNKSDAGKKRKDTLDLLKTLSKEELQRLLSEAGHAE